MSLSDFNEVTLKQTIFQCSFTPLEDLNNKLLVEDKSFVISDTYIHSLQFLLNMLENQTEGSTLYEENIVKDKIGKILLELTLKIVQRRKQKESSMKNKLCLHLHEHFFRKPKSIKSFFKIYSHEISPILDLFHIYGTLSAKDNEVIGQILLTFIETFVKCKTSDIPSLELCINNLFQESLDLLKRTERNSHATALCFDCLSHLCGNKLSSSIKYKMKVVYLLFELFSSQDEQVKSHVFSCLENLLLGADDKNPAPNNVQLAIFDRLMDLREYSVLASPACKEDATKLLLKCFSGDYTNLVSERFNGNERLMTMVVEEATSGKSSVGLIRATWLNSQELLKLCTAATPRMRPAYVIERLTRNDFPQDNNLGEVLILLLEGLKRLPSKMLAYIKRNDLLPHIARWSLDFSCGPKVRITALKLAGEILRIGQFPLSRALTFQSTAFVYANRFKEVFTDPLGLKSESKESSVSIAKEMIKILTSIGTPRRLTNLLAIESLCIAITVPRLGSKSAVKVLPEALIRKLKRFL
jgi:hypothetical protein